VLREAGFVKGFARADDAERNKDVIRRLLVEIDRGNLDIVDDDYAPDYVDRTPSPIRGMASGREGARQAFALFHKAFPHIRHIVEDLIAEGDRVVARISARETHTGELFGQPPTGRVATLTGITIYRLVAGRIAERWSEHGLGVLDQLGIPAPQPTSGSTAPRPTENPR
jgi:predicted ester cyclase